MIPAYDETTNYHALPRIAWVVVATPKSLEKYGLNLAQLSCYAARLGVPFYLEHRLMIDDRHFFSARHRSVAKYLRYYQWVFATDADLIVANSTKDIRDYLDDTVDVMLNQLDRDKEVCACAFFIRNSPGGWEFLRRWLGWSDSGFHQNSDNGDLIEMIAAGLRPGLPNNEDYSGRAGLDTLKKNQGVGCVNLENNWDDYERFLDCVQALIEPRFHASDSAVTWDADLWEFLDNYPTATMRTWKPLSGFLRYAEPFESWFPHRPWDFAALPGDHFIHGKNLHSWMNEDGVLCSGRDWLTPPAFVHDLPIRRDRG